tara:strand:+ start:401 stop:1513 length:1113 start_codon:yes stop_codon:yes gene_type:complete
MAYAIMRSKKHKLGGGLKSALQHLYRERETPNADTSVSNLRFKDDGEQSTEAALERLYGELKRVSETSNKKIRKDAIVAVEYVMTASPEWFSDDPKEREKQAGRLATEAREWLRETYPDGRIIAAQIHMDETTPHLSIFVTPTVKNDDRLTLSAKTIIGNKTKMSQQQDSFAARMKPLGLKRGVKGSQATHESVNRFYGRLKAFEGQKSELVERYRAEIDKLDNKLIGGKGDLVELAKLMADDLATLQSNYKRTVSEQSKEAEEKRLNELKHKHSLDLFEVNHRFRETTKRLEKTTEELNTANKKRELYNAGLDAVDEWIENQSSEDQEVIYRHIEVMNYEVGSRLYRAGLDPDMPENPHKQSRTQGPKR